MFAYPDAQRYRLGVNYTQLPPNRAICPVYAPYERDGFATMTKNYGGDPNYVRSALLPNLPAQRVSDVRHTERLQANAFLGSNEKTVNEDDYQQPRELWSKVFDQAERAQWVTNVSETLEGIPEELRLNVIAMFSKVEPGIGRAINAKFNGPSHL